MNLRFHYKTIFYRWAWILSKLFFLLHTLTFPSFYLKHFSLAFQFSLLLSGWYYSVISLHYWFPLLVLFVGFVIPSLCSLKVFGDLNHWCFRVFFPSKSSAVLFGQLIGYCQCFFSSNIWNFRFTFKRLGLKKHYKLTRYILQPLVPIFLLSYNMSVVSHVTGYLM